MLDYAPLFADREFFVRKQRNNNASSMVDEDEESISNDSIPLKLQQLLDSVDITLLVNYQQRLVDELED